MMKWKVGAEGASRNLFAMSSYTKQRLQHIDWPVNVKDVASVDKNSDSLFLMEKRERESREIKKKIRTLL
jgi:hypothetical protein